MACPCFFRRSRAAVERVALTTSLALAAAAVAADCESAADAAAACTSVNTRAAPSAASDAAAVAEITESRPASPVISRDALSRNSRTFSRSAWAVSAANMVTSMPLPIFSVAFDNFSMAATHVATAFSARLPSAVHTSTSFAF